MDTSGFRVGNDIVSFSDNDLVNSQLPPNVGSLLGTVQAFAGGSDALGSAGGSAFASANTKTGALKARVNVDRSGSSTASASADTMLTEQFVLNGTGTFTAFMAVDLNVDVFGNWNFQANINSQFGFEFLDFSSQNSPSSFFIDDQILKVSGRVTNAQDRLTSVSWYLLSAMASGSRGTVDASNTATIFYETTGNLTATPSASSFLSEAVYPSDVSGTPAPVPVPASLPLLLAGIAGLGFVARRKRK